MGILDNEDAFVVFRLNACAVRFFLGPFENAGEGVAIIPIASLLWKMAEHTTVSENEFVEFESRGTPTETHHVEE